MIDVYTCLVLISGGVGGMTPARIEIGNARAATPIARFGLAAQA